MLFYHTTTYFRSIRMAAIAITGISWFSIALISSSVDAKVSSIIVANVQIVDFVRPRHEIIQNTNSQKITTSVQVSIQHVERPCDAVMAEKQSKGGKPNCQFYLTETY